MYSVQSLIRVWGTEEPYCMYIPVLRAVRQMGRGWEVLRTRPVACSSTENGASSRVPSASESAPSTRPDLSCDSARELSVLRTGRTYIHTYIHNDIHTYFIHTYIHTVCTCNGGRLEWTTALHCRRARHQARSKQANKQAAR